MVAARIDQVNLARVFLLRNTRKTNCGIVRAFDQTDLIAQHRRVVSERDLSVKRKSRKIKTAL